MRFLFVGKTGCGKSTIINSLINKSSEKNSLKTPAKTSEYNNTSGTTDKITCYFLSNKILIDTIGFCDPRFDGDQILNHLYDLLLNAQVGVNRVFFCLKHGVLTQEDKDLYCLIKNIFGDNYISKTTLIVTHYDKNEINIENYIEDIENNDNNYYEFISNFKDNNNSNIILGSNRVDEDNDVDNIIIKRRNIFREKIVNEIFKNEISDNIFLKIRNFKDLMSYIVYYFKDVKKITNYDEKLLFQIINLNKKEDVKFYGYTCSICTEKIINDVYVPICLHIHHFDCIRVWLQEHNTCPLCRKVLYNFIKIQNQDIINQDVEYDNNCNN